MSGSGDFVRATMKKQGFDAKLTQKGKVMVKMSQFNVLHLVIEGQQVFAYFGINDILLVDNLDQSGYRVTFQRPLYSEHDSTRVCWKTLERDCFMLPDSVYFERKDRIRDFDFLQCGLMVQTTENTRFMYPVSKKWSPYFAKGTKFKVVAHDEHTAEIMLQPETGGPEIQLHRTNAHFLQKVQEQSPEDLPANDGVGTAEAMLPSDVQELRAVVREQAQLVQGMQENYQHLFALHETSLKRRVAQATGAGESLPSSILEEQAQLVQGMRKNYQHLFAMHQTSLKRRIAQATGAGESPPSSILEELLQMAMCPFLAETPEPSDLGVLENGQLVSLSNWAEYTSRRPDPTTRKCPLTRDTITQKPIVCRALRDMVEVLQSMKQEQQKESAATDVDGASSDAKRRKL